MEENYMDKFNSPEEYIKHKIIKSQVLKKIDLYRLIVKKDKDFKLNKKIKEIKISELFEILIQKMTYEELSNIICFGVSDISFMIKFNITENETLTLKENNKIKCVGKKILMPSKKIYYIYNVFDYFNLKKEEINKCLNR